MPLSPLHLPAELAAIEAVSHRLGDLPQVVCFDTAFHHTLPMVARCVALPAALFDAGVRRYGFHGLSYASIVGALPAERLRRAVIAHLGSGAGTRAGDLDPGLLVTCSTTATTPGASTT